MDFVLASHNQKKLAEMRSILVHLGVSIQPLPAHAPEPIEDGDTFEANALIKARAACTLTGLSAIADDSGLCVDALGGAPGIYSARYCEGTDEDRNELLLRNMAQLGAGSRAARFVCAVACVFPDGREFTVRGECAGEILAQGRGASGFGYDPLFYLPEHECTFGELSSAVKNTISHRARALNGLAGELGVVGEIFVTI